MKYNLIDEYRFLIHPIILGGGIPLFTAEDHRKELTLTEHHLLHSGVVELIYRPKNPPADS
jgi:dihydrofolate reductase